MKNLYLKREVLSVLFAGVFFLIAFVPGHAAAEFRKTKIAVLDFQLQGKGFDNADMGKIVAEWLITAMVKEGRFDVIERRLMDKIIEEQKFGHSGLVDMGSASKLGKLLGARAIITGSVMKFQNIIEVNARIINVQDSDIIAAENVKSTSTAKLEDIVFRMAEKIIRDFPLEGYIVRRDENKVYIDLGKQMGIKPGMQFIVYKEGKVIKHPKTGEVLDAERIDTGTIEISEVKDKTSIGIIRKETATNAIQYGQMVKNICENEAVPVHAKAPAERPEINEPPVASDGALLSRLQTMDPDIEELRMMRQSGNRMWKAKCKGLLSRIKALASSNREEPDIYLYYAKIYSAAGIEKTAAKYMYKREQLMQGRSSITKGGRNGADSHGPLVGEPSE